MTVAPWPRPTAFTSARGKGADQATALVVPGFPDQTVCGAAGQQQLGDRRDVVDGPVVLVAEQRQRVHQPVGVDHDLEAVLHRVGTICGRGPGRTPGLATSAPGTDAAAPTGSPAACTTAPASWPTAPMTLRLATSTTPATPVRTALAVSAATPRASATGPGSGRRPRRRPGPRRCRETRASTTGSSVSHMLSITWVSRTPSAMAWWKRVTIAQPTLPSSRHDLVDDEDAHSGRVFGSGLARCSDDELAAARDVDWLFRRIDLYVAVEFERPGRRPRTSRLPAADRLALEDREPAADPSDGVLRSSKRCSARAWSSRHQRPSGCSVGPSSATARPGRSSGSMPSGPPRHTAHAYAWHPVPMRRRGRSHLRAPTSACHGRTSHKGFREAGRGPVRALGAGAARPNATVGGVGRPSARDSVFRRAGAAGARRETE